MRLPSKILLVFGVIAGCLGLLLIWQSQYFGNVKMVACNVGQGDGILLQSSKGSQMLIDGGPNNQVLDCLSKHVPFWDRKIELIVNTHPQQDHLFGLLPVIERYDSSVVLKNGLSGDIEIFDDWEKIIADRKINVFVPKAGDSIVLDNLKIDVLWPDYESQILWKTVFPSDLNDSSIVLKVTIQESGECIYLTGDASLGILENVLKDPCDVLKVAHHGSKTGTSDLLLSQVKPLVALIQAGEDNRYGHPHKEVLDMFLKSNTKVLRNDLGGDVTLIWRGGRVYSEMERSN